MVGQNEKGTWGSLKWIAIARAGKSEREDIFNFVIICSLLSGKAHNRFHIGCCSEGQNPKVGHWAKKGETKNIQGGYYGKTPKTGKYRLLLCGQARTIEEVQAESARNVQKMRQRFLHNLPIFQYLTFPEVSS